MSFSLLSQVSVELVFRRGLALVETPNGRFGSDSASASGRSVMPQLVSGEFGRVVTM